MTESELDSQEERRNESLNADARIEDDLQTPDAGADIEFVDVYLDPDTVGEDASADSYNESFHKRLSHDEVAAVSADRAYYVSDGPSPYLSERQAREDIHTTRRRRSTIITMVVIVLLLVCIGGLSGYLWRVMHGNTGHKTTEVVDPATASEYRTASVVHGEFLATIDATSLVRPIDERPVNVTVAGNVAEIFARDGASVEIGATLYRLENTAVTEAYTKAETELNDAKAVADAKKATLEEANVTVAALETAMQTQPDDRATQSAYATAQTRAQTAKEESDAAENTLKTLQDTFDRAKEANDALTIKAPIAGTVTQVEPAVVVGTPVTTAQKLCLVSDITRFCVDVEIPPAQIGAVKQNQEVRLTFPSIPDLGIVTAIDSIRDEGSIRLARIGINRSDHRLSVGSVANASIVMQSIPNSLIVPLDAVRVGEDGYSRITVLLDASRGIKTDITVNVVATNGTQAAIVADNVQEGNAVILNDSLAEVEQQEQAARIAQERQQEQSSKSSS